MLNPTKNKCQVFLNQALKLKKIGCLILLGTITGCTSLPYKKTKKDILLDFQSQKFRSQHTGLFILDLRTNDVLIDKNGSKYFTPASTTKLFTLYTALRLLQDTLPSLKYSLDGDRVYVMGTGDPTWHHPYFQNKGPIAFLKQFETIFLYLDSHQGGKFGPGWAWEDYPYYFSPEITEMPLNGNVVTVHPGDSINVFPKYFQDSIAFQNHKPLREWKENQFYVPEKSLDTLQIPYITSKALTRELLSEAIEKNVVVLDSLPNRDWKVLPGISRDSVLKQMLWESDNFLAEQLMLLASSTLSDTLDFKTAKEFIWEKYLSEIPNKPRWVDGSGLSRYNLFTPKSMVSLLQKLHHETDSSQLFSLMPQWNSEGTLDVDKRNATPSFIYAKSGSMGNMYNLCGYLETKSGKLLAFSFMNNHFLRPSSEVRTDMYNILMALHHTY